MVDALKSFVFEVLAKASSQFRETGIVHNFRHVYIATSQLAIGWPEWVGGVLKTTPPILSPRAFSLSYIKSADFQNDLGLFFYRTIS